MITPLLICGLTLASGARAEILESVAANARTFSVPQAIFTTAGANPWSELLHRIGKSGEYGKPLGDDAPIATFGLSNIRPNVTRETGTPHKADYVSMWGLVDENNKFHPSFVTLVSEDWQAFTNQSSKPEVLKGCAEKKCFYIDQWLFTLELDGSLRTRGELAGAHHQFVIEDTDGRVYDSGGVQGATDDQGKAKLADLLNQWEQPTSK